MGIFCGPKIVAPSEPRMGWTSSVVVTFHSTLFGSSLASGTVWLGAGAVDTVVPLALTPAVGKTDTEAETAAVLMLGSSEEELLAVGAAAVREDRTMAQKTDERSLFILKKFLDC